MFRGRRDVSGELVMLAVDHMVSAAENMRSAAKRCDIVDVATHANAFGFYEGMLAEILHEKGLTIDQLPSLKGSVDDARTEYMRAQAQARQGCECEISRDMGMISRDIDQEYIPRRMVDRRGRDRRMLSAEDQYETDTSLRRTVFGY